MPRLNSKLVMKLGGNGERKQNKLDLTLIDFNRNKSHPCFYCGKNIIVHRWAFRIWNIEQDEDGNNKLHICEEYLNATPEKHAQVHRIKALNCLRRSEGRRYLNFVRLFNSEKLRELLA